MAGRRRRGLRKRTRRQLQGWGMVAAALAAVWVAGNWARVWPVMAAVLAIVVVGGIGWGLLRAHRSAVDEDRQWRVQEEAKARELSMAGVDALTWQDFERYVADLCRRDGCTEVVVSGRSGDLGADVVGYLADGRKLVVQVKKYAPERSVSSQDRGSSAPPASSMARTSLCSSPRAARSRRPRSAWWYARTSWPCTATCWAPGSRAPIWRR
ncbi:restriction endonuclease [Actinomycetota bacterium Odt1-20B]